MNCSVLTGGYYSGIVLCLSTVIAVISSAIKGNRHGDPAAGVPLLIWGVFAAEAPALYVAFKDPSSDLSGPVLGGLVGFGFGFVVGFIVVAVLITRWSRNQR